MLRLIYGLLHLSTKLFNFLWKKSNKYSASRIQNKARRDSHAAVRERKRLLRHRRVIKTTYHILISAFAACAGLFLILLGLWGQFSERWDGLTTVLFIIAGVPLLSIAVGSIKALLEEGIGNISTAEPADIIYSGIPYALYLRAFKADSRRSVFNEEQLALGLYSQNVLMVAVGLPEEVDAPPGAVRIYISNDTWQEQVQSLLDYASYVLLRVCNTEPCLWEVEQALASQKDLYVIVDDMQEYNIVHAKYPLLPTIAAFQPDEYVIYRRIGTSDWENITPAKPRQESSSAPEEDSERLSFKKDFVTSLLDCYPKLPVDATVEQYEASLDGLCTNMLYSVNQALKNQVASRIMDLLESYCYIDAPDNRVLNNAQCYLKKLERFYPLPDELQNRKEDLEKELAAREMANKP